MESNSATRTTEQQFKSSSILRRFITQVNSGHFLGGGGGVLRVNVCWVSAAGLSELLPHYNLFLGQL